MRENKLCVKVTPTAEASVGSVHYNKTGYGMLSTQWHMQLRRRAEPNINRDGMLRFLRVN